MPLLAVLLVFAGLVGLGLAHLAGAASREAAAQAAADASALAGADAGRSAAEHQAVANDARLVGYRQDGLDVVVTLTRRGHRATARARWAPTGPGAGAGVGNRAPPPGREPG